ncbi:MAG: hypothetical protein GY804_01690 [Alphaproteobacteria bacterium]|nr:hypothetical protein [Alphaproteobacteria bacterium]
MSNPMVTMDFAFKPGIRCMKMQPVADDAAISFLEVYHYASNNHLISANKHVQNVLDDVRERDILRLKGYLVEMTLNEGGGSQRSSLTRTDIAFFGITTCEVMWVDYGEITTPEGEVYTSDNY